MSNDDAQDLSIEQTITNTFNAINALLSKPMANYHRTAFRSLIVHTIRNVTNKPSFSVKGGTSRLFYYDAIAQQVVAVFLYACADKIWSDDYIADYYLAGEEEGIRMRILLEWYVIKILESACGDVGDAGDAGDESLEALVQQLSRRLQIDDLIDMDGTREVRETSSEPDLRRAGGERLWVIDARHDVAVQIGRARRELKVEEQQFEEDFAQRRKERRKNFDGYLSSDDEG